MAATRYPIRFNELARVLFRGVFIRPSACFVALDAADVRVQMGWTFRAYFPRSSVSRAALGVEGISLGLGVHGFAGRWLVNGSLDGLVTLHLAPTQSARVLGIPVTLRELQISMDDPQALLAALRAAATSGDGASPAA
jgi:hypothetical protein